MNAAYCPVCGCEVRFEVHVERVSKLVGSPFLEIKVRPISVKHECKRIVYG